MTTAGALGRATPFHTPDGSAIPATPNLFQAVVLTAALTLTAAYPALLAVDPGGADRTVVLDHSSNDASAFEGMHRAIRNDADAAEVVTVQAEDESTALAVLQPGDTATFFCTSSGWALVEHRKGSAYEAFTLAGDVTLDGSYPEVSKLDPGGAARNVTLDNDAADAGPYFGKYRRIINGADAAENLVVKAEDGSTTVGTINQNEEGEFYCGASGWELVCIRTIALS